MKTAIIIALAVTLSGCAFSSEVSTPSGKAGYAVSCTGGFSSWATCYEKASKLCGSKGYVIVDKNSAYRSGWYVNEGSGGGGSGSTRSMLVECNT